jgi:predicted peroxiredoxin
MYAKFRKLLPAIAALATGVAVNSASADWILDSGGGVSKGDPQDIVVSLKSDPMANAEMACLAVTFARSLSGGANVTLFVTLDGVTLGDESVVKRRRFKCDTPWGEISLKENLEAFIDDNDNNMVVCPLCWISRYGDEELPEYGVLPGSTHPELGPIDPMAIGKMMLDADKILDF